MLRDAFLSVDAHQLCSKLAVDNRSVADDNDRIELREIDHAFGKPCNGLGLAAAGTVPDQIPTADAFFLHVLFAPQHRPQLMISRENHVALIIDKHKLADDA